MSSRLSASAPAVMWMVCARRQLALVKVSALWLKLKSWLGGVMTGVTVAPGGAVFKVTL